MENLIVGDTPLYALTTKIQDGDNVEHIERYEDRYGEIKVPKCRPGYVTRICDVERGKCLYVVDAMNTGAISGFLSKQKNDYLKYDKSDRKILRNFKGNAHCELYKNLFPDIQKRIEFAYLVSRRNIDGIINNTTDVTKARLYIGRIASYKREGDAYQPEHLLMLYNDYMRFRLQANMYKQYLETLNRQDGGTRDIHVYPEFPKISCLLSFHDKAYRDFCYYQQMENEEKKRICDEKIKSFVDSDEYKQFLYDNNQFSIISVTDSSSLINEGAYLSHYVGGYCDMVAVRNSYIYFLREKSALDTPFFTLEVLKTGTGNGDSYILNQCFTFHDTIDKSNECRKFIEKWCSEKKIMIGCEL